MQSPGWTSTEATDDVPGDDESSTHPRAIRLVHFHDKELVLFVTPRSLLQITWLVLIGVAIHGLPASAAESPTRGIEDTEADLTGKIYQLIDQVSLPRNHFHRTSARADPVFRSCKCRGRLRFHVEHEHVGIGLADSRFHVHHGIFNLRRGQRIVEFDAQCHQDPVRGQLSGDQAIRAHHALR